MYKVIKKLPLKPKFKVGDYAVFGSNHFMLIYNISVSKTSGEFKYNNYYYENDLGEPTEEELNTYFK